MTPPEDTGVVETASQESWTEAVLLFLMLTSVGAKDYAILKIQEDNPDHIEVTTSSDVIKSFCAEEEVQVVPLKDFRADGNSHISIATSIRANRIEEIDCDREGDCNAIYRRMLELFRYNRGRDSFRGGYGNNGFATLPADILKGIQMLGQERDYQFHGNTWSKLVNHACVALMSCKDVYQRFLLSTHPVYERNCQMFRYNYGMFMSKRSWAKLFELDTKTTIGWITDPRFKPVMWRENYTAVAKRYENVMARISRTLKKWGCDETGMGAAPYGLDLMFSNGTGEWRSNDTSENDVYLPQEDMYCAFEEYQEIPSAETFGCCYKGPKVTAKSGTEFVRDLLETMPDFVRDSFAEFYNLSTDPGMDVSVLLHNFQTLRERIPWQCSPS